MGEQKYKIELKELDRRDIIRGLLKLISEKANGIIQMCEDGAIDGQIYDSELKTIEIMQADINQLKSTLEILHNVEVINNVKRN